MNIHKVKSPLSFKEENEHILVDTENGFKNFTLVDGIEEDENYKLIKHKYRDHTEPEKGSMNYVSPFYKYCGWYKKVNNPTKLDDISTTYRFFSPSFLRLVGDENYSIDNIEQTHLTDTHRKQSYITNRLSVDMNQFNNGISFTNTKGSIVEIKPKSVDAFSHICILTNGFHNGPTLGADLDYNGQKTDIVGLIIDWNTMPNNSYLKYYINYDGALVNYRLLHTTSKKNFNIPELKAKLGEIKTLTLDPSDNEYKYEGQPSRIKVTKPENGDRFTWIILEGKIEEYRDNINSSNGLFFNVYIPEEDYKLSTRGLFTEEELYIKDASDLGKLYNGILSLADYSKIPCFPKQGDRLRVVDSLTLSNDPNTSKLYICLQGYKNKDTYVRNPGRDNHHNTGYARYPVGKIFEEALNKYLNEDSNPHQGFTTYKRIG